MEIALALIGLFKDTIATVVVIFLVWVVLAAITSMIQEWVALMFNWKATLLEDTIVQMLGDPLKDRFYNHPLIKALYTNHGHRKPGNIPEDKFALVLFDEVLNSGLTGDEVKGTFAKLKKNVTVLKAMEEGSELKNFAITLDALLIGIEEKADDVTHAITEARARIESWFNNSLEQMDGAYRRRLQIVAIIVGIAIATVLNVDSAAIANVLWNNSVVRQAMAAEASQLPEPNTQPSQQPPSVEENIKNVDNPNVSSLPIGWSSNNLPTDVNGWLAKEIGILLSGLAAAQGAPFWFDLTRKLITRNPPVPPTPV